MIFLVVAESAGGRGKAKGREKAQGNGVESGGKN